MKKLILSALIIGYLPCFGQTDDRKLASQYMEFGETQKAVDIYERLFKQKNESYFSPYLNGLLTLKKFDEAESITKKMMAQHPKSYQYAIELGRIYGEEEKQDQAMTTYTEVLKNMPAESRAIDDIATQFDRIHQTDFAIKAIIQGRKLMNDEHLLASDLAGLYRSKNDKNSMLTEYLSLLQTKPKELPQVKRNIAGALDGDKDYDLLKTTIEKWIKTNPDKAVYPELLAWQYLQRNQFAEALNESIKINGRGNDDGNNIFELCETLADNGAYAEAIKGYQYLVNFGKKHPLYVSAKTSLVDTKFLLITAKGNAEELHELEKDYLALLSEFGKNKNTAVSMENLAKLQAFYLMERNEAEQTLADLILIPGISTELLTTAKLELGDVYLINGKPWEATLIYSQIEKAFPGKPAGQDAAFRNAKLAYYTGDFRWSKERLDELKAETTEFIDNDALNLWLMIGDHTVFDSTANALKMYARADLLIFKKEPAQAIKTLDSITVVYPVNDLANDILMAKARIQLQQNDFTAAVVSLKKIASGPVDEVWTDDAIYMLGDIYQNRLNDPKAASDWYQKIISDYPGSPWVNEARRRFRLLRGDEKQTP